MNIAVFGASGQTGKLFVDQALAAGHMLTALVRDPTKLGVNHPNLQIVHGDALDKVAVEAAVRDMQVVVSLLAKVKDTPNELLPISAEYIISAMHIFGVRRLIVCAPVAIPFEDDAKSALQSVGAFISKLNGRRTVKPENAFVDLVKNSSLEWTIVRMPKLIDGTKTGKLQHGAIPPGKAPISRADAADFLVKQLTDATYIQKAVVLMQPTSA